MLTIERKYAIKRSDKSAVKTLWTYAIYLSREEALLHCLAGESVVEVELKEIAEVYEKL